MDEARESLAGGAAVTMPGKADAVNLRPRQDVELGERPQNGNVVLRDHHAACIPDLGDSAKSADCRRKNPKWDSEKWNHLGKAILRSGCESIRALKLLPA